MSYKATRFIMTLKKYVGENFQITLYKLVCNQ